MIELGTTEFWDRAIKDPALLAHEVCSLDLNDIEGALQKQPALYAWVSAAHEGARIEEERARWNVTKAEAVAMLTAKAFRDPHTDKPKTVGVLQAEVDVDDEVGLRKSVLFAAMEKRAALRAMTDALSHRRDMLVQLAARQRDEAKEYR